MATFWTDCETADPRVSVIVTESDSNGTILALGDESLLSQKGFYDRVESLAGGFVTGGFWDSHVHLLEFGRSLSRLRLGPDDDLPTILAKVRRRAAHTARDAWVIGAGWGGDVFGFASPIEALDEAAGSHPALLTSYDYHTVWFNRQAIKRLGLTGEEALSAGRTGLLREKRAFWAQEQAYSGSDSVKPLEGARRELCRLGLVGVTAMEPRDGFMAMQQTHAVHRGLRVQVFLWDDVAESLAQAGIKQGFGDDFLRVMGIKLFADGALGSRTAWMFEPYLGDQGNRGVATLDGDALKRWAQRLGEDGLLAAVHAIGDMGVSEVAKALALYASPDRPPLSRIEHAELLNDETLRLLARSKVGLSMQPAHLIFDREPAARYWGERTRAAFRFKDILQQNVLLAFGSDAPIASPDPVLGLWAAVHRSDSGDNPWHSEQRLTPDQAIWCYTRGPALMDGRPSGLVAPGYWGDFTVWREDPRVGLALGERDRLAVLTTVVAGRRVAQG